MDIFVKKNFLNWRWWIALLWFVFVGIPLALIILICNFIGIIGAIFDLAGQFVSEVIVPPMSKKITKWVQRR